MSMFPVSRWILLSSRLGASDSQHTTTSRSAHETKVPSAPHSAPSEVGRSIGVAIYIYIRDDRRKSLKARQRQSSANSSMSASPLGSPMAAPTSPFSSTFSSSPRTAANSVGRDSDILQSTEMAIAVTTTTRYYFPVQRGGA